MPAPPPARRSALLDIAIPIYRGADVLRQCLDSLLPTLSAGDRVWLLDDASEDAEVSACLSAFASQWPHTRIVVNPQNLGFVGTSNRAFELTTRDIVLLNSDTVVTPGWLEHLQACLQRNPQAGIVCPLSDRATLLSVVPEAAGVSPARLASLAGGTSLGDMPLPTAVGFCMLIRRELLLRLGGFSEVFAPGYGEENDLSMRALRAGWEILAADRAVVLHHSGGSFSAQRRSGLQRDHQARLDRIWPEYGPLVRSWWRQNPLRAKAEQLAAAVAAGQPAETDAGHKTREPVVHVLHRQYHVGGTERVTRTLIRALNPRYLNLLIYPGETAGAWCDMEPRASELCRELMLNQRWIRPRNRIAGYAADLSCSHSEQALARVVLGSNAKVVHFHHMLQWDSLLLPELARRLGCRVVISVHDFWFNCPVHNQLEHSTGQPCGRRHAAPDQRCTACLLDHARDSGAPGQAGSPDYGTQRMVTYIQGRYELMHRMLQTADRVLVPSHFIRNKLLAAYPMEHTSHILIQPQGVMLPKLIDQRSDYVAAETSAGPADAAGTGSAATAARVHRPAAGGLVVAYFGGDQVLKGAALVLAMARHLAEQPAWNSVRFRIYGRIKAFDQGTLPPNVELRGFYNPDDVSQAMRGVDLALIPSYYEESFSMVASECWAHQVPVLASNRGALQERVLPGINGWLVNDMRPESWSRSLQTVLRGDVLQRCQEALARQSVLSVEQTAAQMGEIYQQLLRDAGPGGTSGKAAPAAGQLTLFQQQLKSLRSGQSVHVARPGTPPQTKVHCLGVVRDHWGTAQYRVRFPLQDLADSGRAGSSFQVVRDEGFDLRQALQHDRLRHVVVQPFVSDEGLAMMEFLHREAGLRITLVVDDLWTAIPADNPVHASLPADVGERLAYAARLSHALVLTTPALRQRLGIEHPNTHVINNALPGWIWDGLGQPRDSGRQRLRIGWSGAPQHACDLAFLHEVMQATRDQADWVFLGMCPPQLQDLASEVHGMVAFEHYPRTLAALGLDLAVAPLAEHEFNRCKSHLKVLEYGILGIPVVAADLEPYRDCPVPLAKANDAGHWLSAIRALMEDQAARQARGRALQQWVRKHHLTQHRRADWLAALEIEDIAD